MTDETFTRDEIKGLVATLLPVVESPHVMGFDYGDLWGDTMVLAFDIAAILYYRDEPIPDDWQYRRGSPLRDLDEITHVDLIDVDADYLRYLGNRAMALRETLVEFGFDY